MNADEPPGYEGFIQEFWKNSGMKYLLIAACNLSLLYSSVHKNQKVSNVMSVIKKGFKDIQQTKILHLFQVNE